MEERRLECVGVLLRRLLITQTPGREERSKMFGGGAELVVRVSLKVDHAAE